MAGVDSIKKGLKDLVSLARRRSQSRDLDAGGADLVTPRADVYDGPDGVLLFVDLPGVQARDLSVKASPERVEIRALRSDRGESRRFSGFVPDGYEATFELDGTLDSTRVDANLADGLLRVEIPRSAASRPRKIEIH